MCESQSQSVHDQETQASRLGGLRRSERIRKRKNDKETTDLEPLFKKQCCSDSPTDKLAIDCKTAPISKEQAEQVLHKKKVRGRSARKLRKKRERDSQRNRDQKNKKLEPLLMTKCSDSPNATTGDELAIIDCEIKKEAKQVLHNYKAPKSRGRRARRNRRRKLLRNRDNNDTDLEPLLKEKCCSDSPIVLNDTTCDELAIDCEMAQIKNAPKAKQALASVAIVDSSMKLVYHAICPPPRWNTGTCKSNSIIPKSRSYCPVTDKQFQAAAIMGLTFKGIQSQVREILDGKKVIGHAIENDLSVLKLNIPNGSVYDTQRHYTPKRCTELGLGEKNMPLQCQIYGLKTLAKYVLGKLIQKGPHDAREDAMATMALYLHDKSNFEPTEIVVRETGGGKVERKKKRALLRALRKSSKLNKSDPQHVATCLYQNQKVDTLK